MRFPRTLLALLVLLVALPTLARAAERKPTGEPGYLFVGIDRRADGSWRVPLAFHRKDCLPLGKGAYVEFDGRTRKNLFDHSRVRKNGTCVTSSWDYVHQPRPGQRALRVTVFDGTQRHTFEYPDYFIERSPVPSRPLGFVRPGDVIELVFPRTPDVLTGKATGTVRRGDRLLTSLATASFTLQGRRLTVKIPAHRKVLGAVKLGVWAVANFRQRRLEGDVEASAAHHVGGSWEITVLAPGAAVPVFPPPLTWRRSNPPLGAGDLRGFWGDDRGLVIGVGGTGPILRSTDDGASFQPVEPGTRQPLYSVWGQGRLVLAGGSHSTLLRSTDAGRTWKGVPLPALSDPAPVQWIWGSGNEVMAVAGGDERTASGGASSSGLVLLRSRDGGRTWQRLAEAYGGSVVALGVTRGEVVLVSSYATRRWRAGKWDKEVRVPDTLGEIVSVTFVGGVLQVLGKRGYAHSTDSGRTFGPVKVLAGQPMALVASSRQVYALGSSDVVYRSTDGGATFAEISLGTPAPVKKYASRTYLLGEVTTTWLTARGHLLVGGPKGFLRRSADHGRTFAVLNHGSRTDLRGSHFEGARGCAAGHGGEGLFTEDGGATWQVGKGGVVSGYAVAGIGATCVVGGSRGSIHRSTDHGRTWTDQRAGEQADSFYHAFADGKRFWLTSSTGAIYRSNDQGLTWQLSRRARLGVFANSELSAGWGNGTDVFVGGAGGVLRLSVDQQRWEKILDKSALKITGTAAGEVYVYLHEEEALRYSADRGATWQVRPMPEWVSPAAMVAHPRGLLYVLSSEGRLWVSPDKGISWSQQQLPASPAPEHLSLTGAGEPVVVSGSGTVLIGRTR